MNPRTLIIALIVSLLTVPSAAPGDPGGAGSKENLDLPFDSLGTSGDEEESPEIIVFFGQEYEGDGFFYCCDTSGSMSGPKLTRLKQEVVKNIQQFSDTVKFSIVFFNSGTTRFPSSGQPATATTAAKAAAISMVMVCQAGGATCPKAALGMSLDYARQANAVHKVIIYLSDGYNTCPGIDQDQYTQSILQEVQQRNVEKVQVNTIGLGLSVDENFMKTLAAQNNGTYSHIAY